MTTANPAQLVTGSDIDDQAYVPQSAPPPPSALIRLSSAGDVYRNLANIRTATSLHAATTQLRRLLSQAAIAARSARQERDRLASLPAWPAGRNHGRSPRPKTPS
jgi:hypothetical protein